MNGLLEYKGYYAKVEYSPEDNVLFGKIEGINDLVTFESVSAEEIRSEFQDAVDDYLEFCERIGQAPDKTYSGSFNIRISPILHKQLAIDALKNNTTLNKTVETAIEDYLHNDTKIKVDTLWDSYTYSTGFADGFSKSMSGFANTYWNGGLFNYAR